VKSQNIFLRLSCFDVTYEALLVKVARRCMPVLAGLWPSGLHAGSLLYNLI
jgi:hypothetical protein